MLAVTHGWLKARISCVLHFFPRNLSVSPRQAYVENCKILLLKNSYVPSTESIILSSAWWKDFDPFLWPRLHALQFRFES